MICKKNCSKRSGPYVDKSMIAVALTCDERWHLRAIYTGACMYKLSTLDHVKARVCARNDVPPFVTYMSPSSMWPVRVPIVAKGCQTAAQRRCEASQENLHPSAADSATRLNDVPCCLFSKLKTNTSAVPESDVNRLIGGR